MDAGRFIGAASVLLLVGAVPAWAVHARNAETKGLGRPTRPGACVEPAVQMRREHPALLAEWRRAAVRDGARIHDGGSGREVLIGLEATCLGCHGNATEFCETCHAEVGVTVSCWGCHSASAPQPALGVEGRPRARR